MAEHVALKKIRPLFERLSQPSSEPGIHGYMHVPLQQKTLTNLVAEWELTDLEKQIRHGGVMFEYLHRRFGRDEGPLNTVFLSKRLIEWLNAPASGHFPLPVTNFIWLIMHFVTPFDLLYDVKNSKGIEDFYLELTSKYWIGMALPSCLVPDSVFDHIAQDYPSQRPVPQPALPLSRGLAYIWRNYIPEVPFAPEDALSRAQFFARFLRFVQITEVDLRLFSSQLINYLNAPLFPSDKPNIHATGLIYEVLRLAGIANPDDWQDKMQVSQRIRSFYHDAFASLILPASIVQPHMELAMRMGLSTKPPAELRPGEKANKKYIMDDVPASAQNHDKAFINIIETGDANGLFNAITSSLSQAIKTTNVPAAYILPSYEPYVGHIKNNKLENYPWGKINLFAVDLSKCADTMLSLGLATMNGRINIGYCTWETSQLPKAHQAGLDLLDEIWVPTEQVRCIMTAATSKPVYVMPYPVTVAAPSHHIFRGLYGIPNNAYVFVSAIDCFDLLARKNVLNTAKIFLRAFPENPDVRLIIHIRNIDKSNAPKEHALILRLQEIARKDSRIILCHENLTDSEFAGLLGLADCVVSLHRFSAYGRTVMQAMLLGKPVIVSQGTGPADYASDQTAFIVKTDEASIVFDAYKYLDRERGHRWFDPDIADAVRVMKCVINNRSAAQTVAAAGQALIRNNYNPLICGARMAQRIHELIKDGAA